MQHAISGSINRGATVLMALNQLHYLSKHRFDLIICVDDGVVVEQGSFDELVGAPTSMPMLCGRVAQRGVGMTAELMKAYSHESSEVEEKSDSKDGSDSASRSPMREEGNSSLLVVQREGTDEGQSVMGYLVTYWRAMGWGNLLRSLSLCVAAYGSYAFCDVWLALWVRHYDELDDGDKHTYGLVYVGGCLLQLVLMLLLSASNALASINASRTLHSECLEALLHAPMSWFESTPSGRVTSRFSGDLSVIDTQLKQFYDSWLHFSAMLLAMLLIILILVPWMTPILAIGAVTYALVVRAVDRTNREVKRIMNNALSPLQSNFSDIQRGRNLLQVRP